MRLCLSGRHGEETRERKRSKPRSPRGRWGARVPVAAPRTRTGGPASTHTTRDTRRGTRCTVSPRRLLGRRASISARQGRKEQRQSSWRGAQAGGRVGGAYVLPAERRYGADALDELQLGGVGEGDLGYEDRAQDVHPRLALRRLARAQVRVRRRVDQLLLRVSAPRAQQAVRYLRDGGT